MKSKFIFPLLFTVLVCGTFSCSSEDDTSGDDPSATKSCFEIVNQTDYSVGLGIAFDSGCSANAISYSWDFGDGNFSSEENPSHSYREEGTYVIILTVKDELQNEYTARETITIGPSKFIEHAGYIDDDQIWEKGQHLIRANVTIRHGSLTIQPGAEIFVNAEESLIIGHRDTNKEGGALLTAIGTKEEPIQFKPASGIEQPGEWGNIIFMNEASDASILKYCKIMHGGKADSFTYPGVSTFFNSHGFIDINESKVAIEDCEILGAINWGIRVTDRARFSSFTNNKIDQFKEYPLHLDIGAVHTIGEGNDLGTSGKAIIVTNNYIDKEDPDILWRNMGLPYWFSYGGARISLSGNSGVLKVTIEPGTTLAFLKNTDFSCGVDCTLIAEGTPDNPIIFTSQEEVKEPGQWGALRIGANDRVKNCIIEYGGVASTTAAAVYLSSGTNTFSDNIIRESEREGLNIATNYETSLSTTLLENNKIMNCKGYGISVYSYHAHLVPLSNTLENTLGFHVSDQGIRGEVTWPVRPDPYIVRSLIIRDNSSVKAKLTLPPGTRIEFPFYGYIEVGYSLNSAGVLIAEGTPENPIVFTKASFATSEGLGNWGSIRFGDNEGVEPSKITNCIIEYGGNNKFSSNSDAMVVFGFRTDRPMANPPVFQNNTIKNSETFGVYVTNDIYDVSNNTFENNTLGDIDIKK
ncbi:PKD domain-containing protein [Aquimarina sp. U1-2]|uniref:PKD domain-containing protein n=1 Tax=Aquimarina sp. U1-2 TaxID=2823141 RepID=UPI001AEC93AC|nr:PKD domain-containing protein [Aquimarina sp. U1-2]MBP2832532.1 PKD domain-containing protein [Aquimarina sp. U1-2]